MNSQDIVKNLAERGISVSEQEVQSKIDSFSKAFFLPPEEAARAALSHFSSKQSTMQTKTQAPAPAFVVQAATSDKTTIASRAPIAPPDVDEKVFALIVDLSNRVPHRLADFSDVLREAVSAGIAENKVLDAVKNLIESQRCIEPLLGKLYPLQADREKKRVQNNPTQSQQMLFKD